MASAVVARRHPQTWPATLPELAAQGPQDTSRNDEAQERNAQDKDTPVNRIRRLILEGAVPQSSPLPSSNEASGSTWRSITWKLLLGVSSLPAEEYLSLVALGPSVAHAKIRNDTFRTLTTDAGFRERVGEEQLVRVLDAFVWSHQRRSGGGGREDSALQAQEQDRGTAYQFTYVQGMNVLAAPFLYTMPTELEAFHCLKRFLEVCCPLYVQPTLSGVHRGLAILDQCLEELDKELYTYLRSKNLSAELYAFPSVLTLCACTPPLDEVLHLWDFLLAFGVHMNVLCVIAQLQLLRADLLAEPSPMKLLRTLPPIADAREIIRRATDLAARLSPKLYDALVTHTYDPAPLLVESR